MKTLFVSLCEADLNVPEFSWQCGAVAQIDRGMTQNQLSGLSPLAWKAAEQK